MARLLELVAGHLLLHDLDDQLHVLVHPAHLHLSGLEGLLPGLDRALFDQGVEFVATHLDPQAGVSQRATFVVDPDGITRFIYVTDLSVGRNPAEVLRVLDALQTDELCPCNWQKGESTLQV